MKKAAAKSKAKKEKLTRKRVAEQAIGESFTEQAVKVTDEPKGVEGKPYMIFVDAQAVAYLRVSQEAKSAKYIINTGSKSVDIIEMDTATAKSRGLQEVPEASVLETAKVLAKPLVSGIIVSERAMQYLKDILADKELIEMANKKAATTTKKSASTKTAARAKSGSRSTADAIVVFKKNPKEGELPPQAVAIVTLLQKAGELTVAKLLDKMSSVVKTKQSMQTIFSFYKSRLLKDGYIAVKAAA